MEPIHGETFFPDFITYDATGAPVDADSAPTCEVYEDGDAAALAYAPTVTQRGSLPGQYYASVELTTGNGFEVSKTYSIYAVATVDTIATKTKIASFVLREYSTDTIASLLNTLIGTPVTDVSADIAAIKAQTDLIVVPLDVNVVQWLGTAVTADTAGYPNVNTSYIENTSAGAAIASQVWDSSTASYTTPGSFGAAVAAAGNPWDLVAVDNNTSGTMGELLNLLDDPLEVNANVTAWDGSAVMATTAGVPDVNVLNWNNTAAVGSGGSPDVSVIQWLGTAVTADTAGVPNVNANYFSNQDPGSMIENSVWDATTAAHATADTFGEAVAAAGNPWSSVAADNNDAGTMGELLNLLDNPLDVNVISSSGVLDVNVQQWLGTAVTADTAGVPNVNTNSFANQAVSMVGGVPQVDILTSSIYIDANVQQWLGTAVVATSAGYPDVNVFNWNGIAATGNGTPDVNVVSMGTDALTADALAADAVDEIVGNVWGADIDTYNTADTFGGAVGMNHRSYILANGAVNTGTIAGTSITLDGMPSGLGVEGSILVLPGANGGARKILTNSGGGVLTLEAGFNADPTGRDYYIVTGASASAYDDTDLMVVVDAIQAKTDLIPADPATETSVAATPAAVWDVDLSTHTTAGTAGDFLNYVDNIPADIWGAATEDNNSSGTFGELVNMLDDIKVQTDQFVFTVAGQVDANALTGGGGASAEDVADAVWDEATSGHTTAGSFGARAQSVTSFVTTIATLSSQTSFTLTDGPPDDDALNCMVLLIRDASNAAQFTIGAVRDYTGSSKTVSFTTSASPFGTKFTVAVGDSVTVLGVMPLVSTLHGYSLDVTLNGNAGIDWANVENATNNTTLSNTVVATVTNTSSVSNPVAVNILGSNVITAASMASDASTEIAAAVRTNLATELGYLTGDAFARLGAPAGDSVSADIAAVKSAVDTVDDLVDTEIAAIKAKTDNLPADPADASDIAAAFATVNTKLDAIDDLVDTEVSAIKVDTAAILEDTGSTGVVFADSEDVYPADIQFTRNLNTEIDEYTVVWYRNGAVVTSGITSPTIMVTKRSDGTSLVSETAMTQIGSTGSYKYDEAEDFVVAGRAYLVTATAVINGTERVWVKVIGRDSTAS